MPRKFDYQCRDFRKLSEAEELGRAFPELEDFTYGRNEIPDFRFVWHKGPVCARRERGQFTRNDIDGQMHSNRVNDRIFSWLSREMEGPWQWQEESVERGTRIRTQVWIREEADIERFQREWGDVFDLSQSQHDLNMRIRADEEMTPAYKL